MILNTPENGNDVKSASRVQSKPKLFSCDFCDFESQFSSGMKTHMKRIHAFTCFVCKFQAANANQLEQHQFSKHKGNKRSKQVLNCDVSNCGSTFENEKSLKEHINGQHERNHVKFMDESNSPTSSPPRKKLETRFGKTEDENEVDMLDLEIESENIVRILLENRIKELEKAVNELHQEKFCFNRKKLNLKIR